MPTEDQFYNAIHKLLPPGRVWPGANEVTNLNTLIRSIAAAVKDCDDNTSDEFDDVFPDSYVPGNYLEDWERVLGLPKSFDDTTYFLAGTDTCQEPLSVTTTTTPTPATDEDRRDYILSVLQSSIYNNDQFYIDVAAVLGYTVTIATISPCEWTITVAGGSGDIDLLTATCEFFKPAHTRLTIIP